jgi:hypothetical protein
MARCRNTFDNLAVNDQLTRVNGFVVPLESEIYRKVDYFYKAVSVVVSESSDTLM